MSPYAIIMKVGKDLQVISTAPTEAAARKEARARAEQTNRKYVVVKILATFSPVVAVKVSDIP